MINPQDEAREVYAAGIKAAAKGNHYFAYDCFMRAIELNPHETAYRVNFAITATKLARPQDLLRDQAVFQMQEVARLAPHVLGHWIALGEIALNSNKFPESIAAFEHACSMDDTNANVYAMLGFAHSKINQRVEAKKCYERAIELNPELGDVHFLLSCEYAGDNFNPEKQAYHGEKGFTSQKKALLQVESCWNSAHGFLTIGDYEKGFSYFEARLKKNLTNIGQTLPSQRFNKPLWKGEKDCTVRIYGEMGFGDVFIMARYLPLIQKQCNVKIIFESMTQMLPLMRANFPTMRCIPMGDQANMDFDYHLPMMSLPYVCRTRSDSVPWDGPYLFAEPQKIEEWKSKLLFKLSTDKPNIGICWAAGKNSYNASNHNTHFRKSLSFELIKPLLDVKGANFISLQTERDEGFAHPGIKDFSDTAAIIHLMDFVISIDSAVANLTGAMGKELWLPDRYDHCWRWSSVKTPWFPNTKIFRQTKPRVWDDVMAQIKDALEARCGKIAA